MNRATTFGLAVVACAIAYVHFVQAAELAGARRGDLKADRNQFLGNSITRHGPLTSIGSARCIQHGDVYE